MSSIANPDSPCRRCNDRQVGCHGKCERYAEYRKSRDEYAALVRKHNRKREEEVSYWKDFDKRIRRNK